MNKLPPIYGIILFCAILILNSPLLLAQNDAYNSTIWNELDLDQLQHKKFTRSELENIFSKINFFDYVRTNSQREEIIKFMLAQCKSNGYQLGEAKCENILGVIYRDQAQYSESIKMHQSALNQAGNDTLTIIFALNNLGVVYRRLDNPRLALDYHMKALQLSERLNDKLAAKQSSMCIALNSIGNINLSMNQPLKALEVFKQSLEKEKESNNLLGEAINLQNIGGAFEMLGKLDTALYYYNESLTVNDRINSVVGRAICNNSIGNIYLLQGHPLKALGYFNRALIFSNLTNDKFYISQTHANLGRVYLKTSQLEEAYNEISTYNEISLSINSGLLIKDSYMMLSDYYEQTHDFKKALENYKLAITVNDSIVNEKNTRYLNELQILYEAQKKEQKIEFLTIENRIKSQQTVALLIIFILIVIIITSFVLFEKKQTQQKQNELEQRLFRSQMNPHFIFNALGSIQSFMYKNEPIKAANYLGAYASLTRSILKNSNQELITLEEEIETLNHYVEIEKMRLRDSFIFKCEIDQDVEPDFTYIPPIMLQPFVENAIHHGLKGIVDKKGLLLLKFQQKKEHLRIEIIDNGVGINKYQQADKLHYESMGIKIFKERMKLIQKKYKKSVNFAIIDLSEVDRNETGTKIIIDFPLIFPND